MADLPPPPNYACEPVRDGDTPHPAVTVEAVSFDTVTRHTADCKAKLTRMVANGTLSKEHARFEAAYLANMGLYNFYEATFYLAYDTQGMPVSLIIARPGSAPRKNAWGRYVNHYLAYTVPGFRRQGYATSAETTIRQQWAKDGYDRVKTLCQSWLGFCYHEHLRDHIWGVKEGKGELVIDSPLHDGPWPDGVPIKARKDAAHDRELTPDEIVKIMTDPAGRFRRTPDEVEAVLAKRKYRR